MQMNYHAYRVANILNYIPITYYLKTNEKNKTAKKS